MFDSAIGLCRRRAEIFGILGVTFIRPAIADAYLQQRSKHFLSHHSVQKLVHRERPLPVQQHYINLKFCLEFS